MYSHMFVPLSEKPDGTIPNTLVLNTCSTVGEHSNKTLIFISGVFEASTFLACLWASCPGGLKIQLKAEILMVVPFSPAISELRSAHCAPSMGEGSVSTPLCYGGRLFAASGEEPGQVYA
jgi:hypothetical protein